MYLIGLTGNIATGKSLVATRLAEHGAQHIDADRVAHRTMEPGQTAWEGVRRRFGEAVVRPDGTVDRAALARIVFEDRQALQDLESIVHPQVTAHIRRILEETEAGVVVLEAIKLLESGLAADCRALWVTTCRADLQLERLRRDRNLSTADAVRRLNAQPDAAAKVARADLLLVNDNTREELIAAVDEEWIAVAAGTAPGLAASPAVQERSPGALIAVEGTSCAEATKLSDADWRLYSGSPTRLCRLLRPLVAALEARAPALHLHVPRQTGYLQFMRGTGFQEVSDRVREPGYAVFRR